MLSAEALALLRRHVEQDGIRVDDANREAHRELAAAGIMYPVSTFARGPDAWSRSRKGSEPPSRGDEPPARSWAQPTPRARLKLSCQGGPPYNQPIDANASDGRPNGYARQGV